MAPDRVFQAKSQVSRSEHEQQSRGPDPGYGEKGGRDSGLESDGPTTSAPSPATVFRGAVRLDSARPTLAFTKINEEMLTHLLSQPDIEAKVRLEVEVRKADGFSEHAVRTVTENARELHSTKAAASPRPEQEPSGVTAGTKNLPPGTDD